jgi:hypothetical protein
MAPQFLSRFATSTQILHFMMNRSRTIVFEADAFCYGPAAIALAVANAVKHCSAERAPTLVGIGTGTCYELFSRSGVFNQCHESGGLSTEGRKGPVWDIIDQSALVVTVVDFAFAEMLAQKNVRPVFIDPLYWMWDSDPISTSICREYYATDFPGVRERIAKLSNQMGYRPPAVVAAVRDNLSLERIVHPVDPKLAVLNFGGLHSPLGMNVELAQTVARNAAIVCNEEGYHTLICGGKAGMSRIADGVTAARITSLSQQDFYRELARCGVLLTASGLSSFAEALFRGRPTLFLPPLNYSQYFQSRTYASLLDSPWIVHFDQFEGYPRVKAGVPEAQGVAQVFELGRRFGDDPRAQANFREVIRRFLAWSKTSGSGLKLRATAPRTDFSGARRIAEDLVSML